MLRKGAICVLDALGFDAVTRDRELVAAKLLAESWRAAEDIKASTGKSWKNLNLEAPEIRFFSDTVVIALEQTRDAKSIVEGVSVEQTILWAALQVVALLQSSVLTEEMSMLYRGAFSFGHYIQSERAIFGPAVTEAARWYERPNGWFVVSAPSALAAIVSSSPLEGWHQKPLAGLVKLSAIPLKEVGNVDLYALDPSVVLNAPSSGRPEMTISKRTEIIKAILGCMALDRDPRVLTKAHNTYRWLASSGLASLTNGRK